MNQPIRKRLFSRAAGTLALTAMRATTLTVARAATVLLMMMLTMTAQTAWAQDLPEPDGDGNVTLEGGNYSVTSDVTISKIIANNPVDLTISNGATLSVGENEGEINIEVHSGAFIGQLCRINLVRTIENATIEAFSVIIADETTITNSRIVFSSVILAYGGTFIGSDVTVNSYLQLLGEVVFDASSPGVSINVSEYDVNGGSLTISNGSLKDGDGNTYTGAIASPSALNGKTLTYYISLDAQGGSGGTELVTPTAGSDMPAITPPTRTGYAFGGYYTETNGGGTQYYNADGTSAHVFDLTGTVTLYAQWTINNYTITFNTNGGSAIDPITQNYGTAISAPAAPTRTGYTFAGWDREIPTTMPAENMTINAQWTKNEVTLTDGEGITALSAFAGQQCDVTYSREFTSGKASTVCLPFAYTKKEGDGSFYAFTSITESGGEYVATMTEPSVSTLTANTPYLYMPSATGSMDFSGTYAIPATLTAGTATSDDWTFVGTYSTVSWTEAPTGIYGFSAQDVGEDISQGQFVKVGAYVRVKPMRCYLEYKNGTENYAGARRMTRAAAEADRELPETIKVRLVSANGNVTAIGTLHTLTGEVVLDGWYTLDGTRLAGQPTRKGIYVNNGKKVVIK